MVLLTGLSDIDNRVFSKENRTDQDEEYHDPNGFSVEAIRGMLSCGNPELWYGSIVSQSTSFRQETYSYYLSLLGTGGE